MTRALERTIEERRHFVAVVRGERHYPASDQPGRPTQNGHVESFNGRVTSV
jgi:hypothetical protein